MDALKGEKQEDFETDYEYEITCPYCGYKDGDSWEVFSDAAADEVTETSCGRCDKDFMVRRNISISYSSWKKGGGE